ncbi:ABC transporter substrate-binding protein [Saccharopolyspora flava]|uniref:NitT/TauT family transport system substrate-binding protein n=1 Tax=Saccharopolyspora flava TaxID=95161 RepID=A0A1I6UTC8_9PSEU|nr:ABC transporter substrate-binding protein [Saccharopolyspora flava]SFT04650.1 NitT/TauT family transport system substrate-binding protein [Saccharopolyspora flava]
MVAGKIDIGSMGDYPLLINGSRAGTGEHGTTWLSVTGYNARGALNGVVANPGAGINALSDLKGKKISASVGSAGHGTLVQALQRAGIDRDVTVQNQEPSIGASALKAGSVDAVSQFVAWPGLLAFRDGARLVYDGGQLDLPTLHGVVARKDFVGSDRDVVKAFLQSQLDATRYLHEHPLDAAESVASATGLPAEVVYLYNGRNGVSTFDTTIKKTQVDALKHDVPFLKSVGVLDKPVNVDEFRDDSLIREVQGAEYAEAAGAHDNPVAITGVDETCHAPVTDPAVAGEVWVRGEKDARPAANPTCLLRNVERLQSEGAKTRAVYVPDATTGTRWFADRAIWLRDGNEFLPFATPATADAYRAKRPGAQQLTWDQALEAVR